MPCCHPVLEIFPGVAEIVPYAAEDFIQLLEHLDWMDIARGQTNESNTFVFEKLSTT